MKDEAKPVRPITNVLANWGAFAVSAIAGFFLSPFIVHQLGDAGYGLWTVIGSLIGYLGLLDLGVRGAVTRFIALHHARSDAEAASRVVSSALRFFLIAAVVAVAVAVVLAWRLPESFQGEGRYGAAAQRAMILCGLTIAVTLMSAVFGGVIAGLQHFSQLSAVDAAIEIGRVLAVYLVLSNGGGLTSLAAIQLTGATLRGLTYVGLTRRLYPELHISLRLGDRKAIREIISYSLSASVIHLSAVLILYSDSVVIGALISVEVVTMFAIAANLTEYARSLLLSFTQTLTPMASAMVGAGDSERLQHLLLRSMRLSLVIMLPVLITFELRGQTFVGIWMGSEYAASSGRVLQILAIGQLFGASYQVLTAIILGLNRHRLMVPIFLVEAATNLVLSITLTGRFGIIGVAIGTAAPRLMVALFVAPILARRMFGISPHPFVREAWLKPLAGAIPFAIASYAVERWWPTDNLFFFFFQVACMLPVAWLGSWFVAVEPSERAQVSQLLRRHLLRTA